MQILIIGGSYGSVESSSKISKEDQEDPYKLYNSITKTEFEVAHRLKIPIYFFVENGVLSEYNTYKKNRENKTIKYAHVSSVNIFLLLDDIYSLQKGNFISGFSKFEDISEWLKMQWAHLMAEFISNRTKQIEIENLNSSVDKLSSITSSLKAYTEEILKKVEPDNFDKIKTAQENIIHIHKLELLEKSPLIRYIKRKDKKNQSTETIYKSLMASSNVTDFLQSIVDKKLLDEISNNPNFRFNEMERDFYELKERVSIL
jgi:hypothetical protein